MGQRMAKGDYATAELLVAKGKEIRQFESEVDALRKRWREVCGSGASKKVVTPLWAYFQPILQALTSLGGEGRRDDLETQVERVMGASFQAGDREGSGRGRERWRSMVHRARKPIIAEGWIEARGGKMWRITDAGRRAAEKPIGKDAGTRG